MSTTITYDLSHLPAAKASRKALADAHAKTEKATARRAEAFENLTNVKQRLRSGDDSVTTALYRNARDDHERVDLLLSGCRSKGRATEARVVNTDTTIAEGIAFALHSDGTRVDGWKWAKFPTQMIVGVADPTPELIDPLRPVVYEIGDPRRSGNRSSRHHWRFSSTCPSWVFDRGKA